MRAHQLDAQGVILQTIIVPALDFMPGLVDASVGGHASDRIVGGVLIPAAPPLPTQAEYVAAAQERLDAFARTRNYDGILSACTYASSAVPRFAAEGQYAVDARDATWAKCYDLLARVQAGALPQPTLPALLDMLPALEWPA